MVRMSTLLKSSQSSVQKDAKERRSRWRNRRPAEERVCKTATALVTESDALSHSDKDEKTKRNVIIGRE